MSKEYLNEEKFQRVNNKVKRTGKIVANIMLLIGIGLIVAGLYFLNNKKEESNVTQENPFEAKIVLKENEIKAEKNNLKTKLSQIKSDLDGKKQELVNKGIKESSNYNDGEAYDLYIIDNALDPSFHHCWFDQYINNDLTKDYCTLTNLINDDTHYYTCEDNEVIKTYCTLNSELVNLRNEKLSYNPVRSETRRVIYIPFIVIGAFVTFASFIVRFMFFSITHRREIMAYSAQQMMPIAEEGVEKMAPTVGRVAKEVAKGIKDGLNEDKK